MTAPGAPKRAPRSPVDHAVFVAALAELDREGRLAALTYQEIADTLEVGHRSTALRLLRQAVELEAQVAEIKRRFPPRSGPIPVRERTRRRPGPTVG